MDNFLLCFKMRYLRNVSKIIFVFFLMNFQSILVKLKHENSISSLFCLQNVIKPDKFPSTSMI